jgi:hypothetical protein
MIIRNINGELIKVNKYDYANDMIYYEKIMNIKKEFSKDCEFETNKTNKTNTSNKTTQFFLPKKVDKKQSLSLQSICKFINIEFN